MRRAGLVALVFGVAAGAVNLTTDYTVLAAVLPCVGAFVAGCLHPFAAWRWGLMSVLAVPLSYAGAEMAGVSSPFPALRPMAVAATLGGPLLASLLGGGLVSVLTPIRMRLANRQHPVVSQTGALAGDHRKPPGRDSPP